MKYVSIMDRFEPSNKDISVDEYFIDLNLDQIVEKISRLWGENVRKFYGYFPDTKDDVQYRRDVYSDIEKNSLYEPFLEAYTLFQKSRSMAQLQENPIQSVRREILFSTEVSLYTQALKLLYESMKDITLSSEGLKVFFEELSGIIGSGKFQKLSEVAENISLSLSNARLKLTYENKRVAISFISDDTTKEADGGSSKEAKERCEDFLLGLYPSNSAKIESPFSANVDLDGIEHDLMYRYIKKHPEIFKEAAFLYKKYKDYPDGNMVRFFEEVPFYLSFLRFERFMAGAGAKFCIPSEDETRRIEASELYDLALYIASVDRHKEVITNDFYYDDNELFFVLTGPNQGGKTTFARSLGQLVFFGKMGLKVPAKEANIHFFSQIVTHFSVEESIETGRGKLMEELVRLSPMMKNAGENSFVIINELFTTAANYDACIMGKRVLSHFIGRKCHGIYVTHLSELLEAEERAVGLSARLDANGIQTFKIERAVMEYVNCARNQVEKYGLTYEKLKERLG